jgi:hypothetical protein
LLSFKRALRQHKMSSKYSLSVYYVVPLCALFCIALSNESTSQEQLRGSLNVTRATKSKLNKKNISNKISNEALEQYDANYQPLESDKKQSNPTIQRSLDVPQKKPAKIEKILLDEPDYSQIIVRQSSESVLDKAQFSRISNESGKTNSIEERPKSAPLNPYDAEGMRVGTFILRPTVEVGVRYADDQFSKICDCFANKAESIFSLNAQSDWLRHSMNVEAKIKTHKKFSQQNDVAQSGLLHDDFRLGVNATADVTESDKLNVSVSVEQLREKDIAFSTLYLAQRPLENTIDGKIGYDHDINKINLNANLNIIRATYTDARDDEGSSVDQSDRNNTNITMTLRGTYETSAVFAPFMETQIGRRLYDNKKNISGGETSSTLAALRVGSEVNFGEKLNGEFSGGWFLEKNDNSQVNALSGLDVRGTLNWSPERLTNITLTLNTQVDGARADLSSSSIIYSSDAAYTRQLRENLDATVKLAASYRNFSTINNAQTTLSAEAGATLWLNRYTGLTGTLQHAQATSENETQKESTTGAYFGIKMRR